MSKTTSAEKIIERHVVRALGAGLMPIPLFDIASVTAVQMDMLKQLADEYGADYSTSSGKAFVSALTGSTLARFAASVIKSSRALELSPAVYQCPSCPQRLPTRSDRSQ